MAASDTLTRLAARAKAAEDRVSAAQTQARAQLEAQVEQARNNVNRAADDLQKQATAGAETVSMRWRDVQQSWTEHIEQIRLDAATRAAERDAKKLQRRADAAERDAVAAVVFAEAALQEAEYAMLDAALARMDANEARQ